MLADYHLHTVYSDDSEAPMEDMVKRAIALGLDEICFTEHVDHGVKTVLNCDYAAYHTELEHMREKYGKRITIRFGIEFGVQVGTVGLYERDFQAWPFDFVIMSCHQVDNLEFWRQEYQYGKTQDEYQQGYYREILETCRLYKNYSVLGHLDSIKRYDEQGEYPDEKILPVVSEIMRQAISDGKGIELNTSCFKYGLKDLTPSRRLLELYYELGGKILTIGSDSHEPEHIADHFPEVREILKQIGFREFCTFEKMRPIFHKL